MKTFLIIIFAVAIIYFLKKLAESESETEKPEKLPRLSYIKLNGDLTDIGDIPEQFIVADIETTGLNPTTDNIIEISALKVKKGDDKHLNLTALVNPGKNIPTHITEITGITDQMVKGEDKIEKVMRELLDFFEDLPLVFYNANFDMKFLRAAAKKIGGEINNEIIDALPIARKAFPDLKNHKLSTVANHLNIDTDGAHRASDDCGITLMVLNHATHKLAQR